jgi:hypothetical protein
LVLGGHPIFIPIVIPAGVFRSVFVVIVEVGSPCRRLHDFGCRLRKVPAAWISTSGAALR